MVVDGWMCAGAHPTGHWTTHIHHSLTPRRCVDSLISMFNTVNALASLQEGNLVSEFGLYCSTTRPSAGAELGYAQPECNELLL